VKRQPENEPASSPSAPAPKSESDSDFTLPPEVPQGLQGPLLDKWINEKTDEANGLEKKTNELRWVVGRAMLVRRNEIGRGEWANHCEKFWHLLPRTALNWMLVAEYLTRDEVRASNRDWEELLELAAERKQQNPSVRKYAHKQRASKGKSPKQQKANAEKIEQPQWGVSQHKRRFGLLRRVALQIQHQANEYHALKSADIKVLRQVAKIIESILKTAPTIEPVVKTAEGTFRADTDAK